MALKIFNIKEKIEGHGGKILLEFQIEKKSDGFLAERILRALTQLWGIEIGFGYLDGNVQPAFNYVKGNEIKNIIELNIESGDILHKIKKI